MTDNKDGASSLEFLPRHESADLGPSGLGNEEAHNRVGHGAPGFTDEQHHGGLEGVDLRGTTTTHTHTHV